MTTPNRNYNEPEAGEEDWHIPVNENWNDIDADVAELFDGGGQLDTDGDDFVIRDSNDNIVLRYDEGGETWRLDDRPLTAKDLDRDWDDDDADTGLIGRAPFFDNAGTDDVTVYAHPDGDDDAEGTVSDPKSLLGALRAVPTFTNNEWTVDLFEAPDQDTGIDPPYEYERDGINSYTAGVKYAYSGYSRYDIVGNPVDREDVQIMEGFHHEYIGKNDHSRVEHIWFRGHVVHEGAATYDNCKMTSEAAEWSQASLQTKSGWFRCLNSELGDPVDDDLNTDFGLRLHAMGRGMVTGTDLYGTDRAIRMGRGSMLHTNVSVDLQGDGAIVNRDPDHVAERIELRRGSRLFDGVGRIFAGHPTHDGFVTEPTQTFDGN